MKSLRSLYGIFGLLLAGHSVTQAANLLTNPSFEIGTPADAGPLDTWAQSAVYPTTGAPFGYVPKTGYLANVPDGTRLLVLNGAGDVFGGWVSQTFATTAGTSYTVKINAGVFSNQTAGKKQRLGITVNGTAPTSLLAVSEDLVSTTGTASLTLKTHTFVADGPSATLILSDLASGLTPLSSVQDSDLLVDFARVEPVVVNTAPVATNDAYPASAGVALNVAASGVLTNDTDAQADILNAVLVSGPSHGTLTLNADGSFTYTATAGYSGSDSFTYRANDGALDSNTATVTLTVTIPEVNLVVNGSFEAGAVGTAPITALDNWTVTGNPSGYISDTTYLPTNGHRVAVFNVGGNVYGGVISQTIATVPGATYTLSYNVGIVGSNSKVQRMTVSATGTVSPFSDSFNITKLTGSPTTWIDKTSTFVASGNSITLSFADSSGALGGATASFSDLLLDHVRLDGAQPVNTAPVATNDSYPATKNTALTVAAATGVLANDTDPESNTLAALLVAGPTHGTLTLNSNGSFTYTPATGYVGGDSFTYKANDGLLDSNTATVAISVNPPVLASLTNGSFELGSGSALDDWNATGTVAGATTGGGYNATDGTRLAVFSGGGNTFGGVLTQTFTTIPGQLYKLEFNIGVLGTAGKMQKYSVAVSGAASLFTDEQTLTAPVSITTNHKTHNFTADSTATTLTFTDRSGTLSGVTAHSCDLLLDNVRVSVVGANTAPVAVNDSHNATANATLTVAAPGVLANDTDAESNPLTAVLVAGPTHGTLTLNANGSFTYTPTAAYTGPDSFTYRASDGLLTSNVATVSITVSSAPVTPLVNGSFEIGAVVSGPITALDGWTVTGNPFGWIADATSIAYAARDGSRVAVFNGNGNVYVGSISQTFTTVPGQTYRLDYDLGMVGNAAAGARKQRMLVSAAGSTSLFSEVREVSITTGTATRGVWTSQFKEFVADSTSTTLTFADNSGTLTSPDSASASDMILDKVQLSEILTTRTLTVNSFPVSGLGVTVSPADLGANGNGTTNFTRSYVLGTSVTLTATAASGPNVFQKWQKDSVDVSTSPSVTVAMDADHTLTAVYIVDNNPRATTDSYTATEDVPLAVAAPGVLANDTDPNSLPITAVLDSNPAHGALVLNSNGSFTYTPAADYHGADSFTYHVSNGTNSSAPTTVSLTVTPVNDLPVANAQTLTTDEDVPLPITLSGSDVDGDTLVFSVVAGPAHGAISGTLPNITYTPTANYHGSDSFTYRAHDGTAYSPTVTVSITVNSIPDVPVATAQSVTTRSGVPVAITLAGTDADGDPVTHLVATQPTHGTLSGTAPNLTYTPGFGYTGADSFTFTVSDGTATSSAATVSITVSELLLNGSFELLTADVPDSWTITRSTGSTNSYSIKTGTTGIPAKHPTSTSKLAVLNDGNRVPNVIFTQSFPTVSGQYYNLTFDMGVNGVANTHRLRSKLTGNAGATLAEQEDSATGPGGTATVWATTRKSLFFIANSATTTLELRDMTTTTAANNSDLLLDNVRIDPVLTRTLTVASSPANGVAVTVSPADITAASNGTTSLTRTYVNNQVVTLTAPAMFGTDRFQKWLKDGADFATTLSTTVTMDAAHAMTAVYIPNQAPVATADTYATDEDVVLVVPAGTGVLANDSDPELGTLTAVLVAGPQHGTLTLNTNGSFTYTPEANYNGSDSFTYRASDGQAQSEITTVSITIHPVNDVPVANAQSVSVAEDGSVEITLTGSDVEGSPLTFVTTSPSHGPLSGTAPNVIYTPAADYNGPDSFTFTVSDGVGTSVPATVSITVTPVNDAPVAVAQTLTVAEDGNLPITLTGSDVENSPLTYTVISQVSHGTLTGSGRNYTYVPNLNYHGPDSFTFKVNDGVLDSAIVTVSIAVTSVNDAPVATAGSASVAEDGQVEITLAGTDVESDPLTYAIVTQPAHGSVSLSGKVATYIPTADYHGADSFTFKVNDGLLDSAPATITITVTPVNDAPVAIAQSVTVAEDGSLPITLAGSDIDGDVLGYSIVAQPGHGSVVLVGNVATYTPSENYHGSDTFTFKVNDGTVDSATATVSITVTPVNDDPVATAQSVEVDEDASVQITLTGTDPESSGLTFAIVTQPQHGSVSLAGAVATYTPESNFHGADSFTFKVNDGSLDSAPATVSITVNPVAEFGQWLESHGLTDGPTVDSDGDSISNAVEYVIGGNPKNQNNANLLPTVTMVNADPDGDTVNEAYLLFTYRRTYQAANDSATEITVDWSTGLGGVWADSAETAGVIIAEEFNGAGPDVDRVKVYIPRSLASGGKLFARLRVAIANP